MKFLDFEKVTAIMDQMDSLASKYEQIESSGYVGVVLDGRYQGQELIDLVRPVVAKWLEDDYNKLKLELFQYDIYDAKPIGEFFDREDVPRPPRFEQDQEE